MYKRLFFIFLLSIFFITTSCSNNNDQTNDIQEESSDTPIIEDSGTEMMGQAHESIEEDTDIENSSHEKKVIQEAELQTNVDDLNHTEKRIRQLVNDYEGYITSSNVFQEEQESRSGHITARIPENNFQDFLNDIEDEVTKVIERNVSGTDVTEDYVDLKARLKSKQTVEKRLLSFMEEAEKTEDLLKISADLDEVQEEVEMLQGKINYLDNQTEYATINIAMNENNIHIPAVDNKDLNTWEKTKRQIATSMNFILSFASTMFIFIVGSTPILLPLAVIGSIIYFIIRKRRGKKSND